MNLPVRSRIVLTLIPLLVLLVGLGASGIVLLWHVGGRIDAILQENYASIVAMERFTDALERVDSSFQFTLAGEEVKAREQYQKNWAICHEKRRFVQRHITLPDEQALVAELTELTDRYQRQGDAFYARPAGDPLHQQDYFDPGGLLTTLTRIKLVAHQITQINQDTMEQASRQAKRTATLSLTGFATGLAAAMVLAGLSTWYTLRAIFGPIRAVTASARGVSAGKLDAVVPYLSSDALGELAQAFNSMTRRLREDRQSAEQHTQELVQTAEALRREISEREQLEQSLRQLAAIVESSDDAIIGRSLDGRITSWNKGAERMYGYRADEVLDGHNALLVPPEYESELAAIMDKARRGESVIRFETVRRRKDGRFVNVSLTFFPVRDQAGAIIGTASISRDITERKHAEEQLRRSNRALVALSSCNEALIRATDESELLQQICRIVVEKAGYRLCWVGYAESDAAKTVRPVAQAGFEEGYLKTVNVTWADVERGRGPTGTCIRTGQPSLLRDIAAEPRFAPWRAEAQKRGYASCIGMPLVADTTVLGALSIYAAEANAFSDAEVKLLTELANDLAFGVVNLRTRAERKRAVELQAAHEQEVKIGIAIQQTLLLDPLPSDVPGLRVAALTVPSKQIDGDFYHFYRHENGCLDVIVADVMGKGIPAALLAAATKSHFLTALAYLMEHAEPNHLPAPRDIVMLAHAEIVQQLINLESFVTLCYVRIDRNRGTLDLVDCGHTGMLLRRAATGVCEAIHGDNLALGMRQGEIYDQLAIAFAPGDLLLLYSDGVTEARNGAGELFGEDRLVQCVQTNGGLDAAELVIAIRTAALTFSGLESPSDDLTCVAITVADSPVPLARQELEIHSDLKELARARAFVRAACHDMDGVPLDEAGIGLLELAVTEACSNIMKHAYHGRTDQSIQLDAEVFPGEVAIRLHHLGDPFDPARARPPRLDGSQESGFGVYLIGQSVDRARYYRDERGRNCVELVKTCHPKGDQHEYPC